MSLDDKFDIEKGQEKLLNSLYFDYLREQNPKQIKKYQRLLYYILDYTNKMYPQVYQKFIGERFA